MARPVVLRQLFNVSLGLLALGCAEDPWTYPGREQVSVGGEVFRVFCKRTAKEAYPEDLEGVEFNAPCLGMGDLPPNREPSEELNALLERRSKLVATIDRILGDDTVMQRDIVQVLEPDEIRNFLHDLVPLYDAPEELLPGASRTLAAVLYRLIDSEDSTGKKALSALAQITGRQGYRKLDLALGLLRPLLEYPELDAFAENGLKAIAKGGVAEKSLDEMSLGLALELANYDPTPPAADSTLLIARDLMLSPIDQLDQPERAPVYITRRDARGVAVPFGATDGNVPGPFSDEDGDGLADVDEHGRFLSGGELNTFPGPYRIAGESKNTKRDDDGRAVNEWGDGKQLYADFDAQPSMAAAFLRETARLAVPLKSGDRTALEKIGRGMSALFGLNGSREVSFGKAKIKFQGPDPASGAFYDLVHAVSATVRTNPDAVRRFLQMFEKAMVEHEPEMAAFVQMAININERGKMHPEAALVGEMGPGTPNRFWDDVIAIAVRGTKRGTFVKDLVSMITEPETVQLGQVLANWVEFSDVTKYKNADFTPANPDDTFNAQQEADLNAPADVKYKTRPDRSQPSVGANRSVFQQTMHMVRNLNQQLCNKQGTRLMIIRSPGLNGTFTLVGGLPLDPAGYPKCELFDVPHMVRLWVRAILKDPKAKIALKPDYLQVFKALGLADPEMVQEWETQIHGFHGGHPTPESFARFIYGPPNQFTKGLIEPVSRDGVAENKVNPYALFAMEVKHQNAGGMTFMQAGTPLMRAFEKNELFDANDKLVDGYLFADLMETFHRHWGSRTDEPCTGVPACTQHMDPKAAHFSYQTDLRSYEPLLIEALRDEKMIETVAEAAKAWQKVTVDGKDGLTIFAELVEVLIKPNKDLAYRDGATTAKNNLGVELGYVSPLYLALDGLKRIDTNFAAPEYADRIDTWHEGRSDIVDLFLTVEGDKGKKRLQDRIGRSVFVRTLGFLADRVKAHQDAKDVNEWADGLAKRSVTFLDTPLVAGLLHLFDQSWNEPAAGRELMKFLAYMVNEEKNAVGFETTLVAVADLLQLLEDSEKIAPILDLAAEAATPGVSKSVESTGATDFDPYKGILRRLVELQNRLLQLHTRRPSTLARVARNLVRTSRDEDQTPLEALIDAISEVERVDPKKPSTAILEKDDLKAIAKSVHKFIDDDGHGLERLYAVIQNRTMSPAKAQEQK
jgi:hypothetical protein